MESGRYAEFLTRVSFETQYRSKLDANVKKLLSLFVEVVTKNYHSFIRELSKFENCKFQCSRKFEHLNI